MLQRESQKFTRKQVKLKIYNITFELNNIMAEEFQAGICGSSWWNTSRHALVASPCSVGFNEHIGSFGCPNDMVDIKASRSSCGEINNSVSDHDDDHQHTDSGSVLIDSTLQMIGFDHSSSSSSTPSDLNQALLL